MTTPPIQAPATLPADFFAKQSQEPPATLPADFFSKGQPVAPPATAPPPAPARDDFGTMATAATLAQRGIPWNDAMATARQQETNPPPLASIPVAGGIPQAAYGVQELLTSGQRLKGASDILEGALRAGSLLIPGAAEAAPVETLLGLASGTAASKIGAAGAKGAGLSPDAQRFAGDLSGVAGGMAGGGIRAAREAGIPSAAADVGNALRQPVGSGIDSVFGPNVATMEPTKAATLAMRPRVGRAKNFGASAETALPNVRRAADDLGLDLKTANLRDFEPVIARAKLNVWNEFLHHLNPNADAPLDVSGVAAAIHGAGKTSDILARREPAIGRAATDAAADYSRPMRLADVEARIQELNNELRSQQSQLKVPGQQIRNDPHFAWKFAELDGLRNVERNAMESMTGPRSGELKQKYGALNVLQDALDRRIPVWERQSEAGGFDGLGRLLGIGKIAKAAVTGDAGTAVEGVTQGYLGKRLQNARNSDLLMRRAVSGTNPEGERFATPVPPAATPPGNRGLQLRGYEGPIAAPGEVALPPRPPVGMGTAAERTGRLLGGAPRAAIPLPGEVAPVRLPQVAPDTTPARVGRLLGPAPKPAIPLPAIPEPEPEGMRVLPAASVVVRDPKTGQMKRLYLTSPKQ